MEELFGHGDEGDPGHLEKLQEFLQELGDRGEGLEAAAEVADLEAWAKVSCLDCARCCKGLSPVFNKRDVQRIATFLRMSPRALIDKWLVKEKGTGRYLPANRPCPFLGEGNKCAIYEARPDDCSGFPHHDKRPLAAYGATYAQNLRVCPATFYWIDKLYSISLSDEKDAPRPD